MIFNLKKEIIIFLAIFLSIGFSIYIFLNGGAYLEIFRYNFLSRAAFAESNFENLKNKSYYLYIPKIGVSAVPIISSESDSIQSILSSLDKGVGLYPGFQLPGQIGRSVILGHSSKASWYSGKYPYVFSLLNKLYNGDEFYIIFENNKLVYKVFASDILTPKQTDDLIVKTPRGESDAVLITCWPIGFSSKRVVIQARLNRVEKI